MIIIYFLARFDRQGGVPSPGGSELRRESTEGVEQREKEKNESFEGRC